jgi:hypothetical protein
MGGKKNDVTLVVGTDTTRHVQWAEVMTWETNELFKIKLRDSITDMDVLEIDSTMEAIKTNITTYHHRKPMADFHYLTAAITPSPTQWAITLIIGLIASIGMSIFFHKNKTFSTYRRF